jgi:hypothetical protein
VVWLSAYNLSYQGGVNLIWLPLAPCNQLLSYLSLGKGLGRLWELTYVFCLEHTEWNTRQNVNIMLYRLSEIELSLLRVALQKQSITT